MNSVQRQTVDACLKPVGEIPYFLDQMPRLLIFPSAETSSDYLRVAITRRRRQISSSSILGKTAFLPPSPSRFFLLGIFTRALFYILLLQVGSS